MVGVLRVVVVFAGRAKQQCWLQCVRLFGAVAGGGQGAQGGQGGVRKGGHGGNRQVNGGVGVLGVVRVFVTACQAAM
jgi:hypothetical protein